MRRRAPEPSGRKAGPITPDPCLHTAKGTLPWVLAEVNFHWILGQRAQGVRSRSGGRPPGAAFSDDSGSARQRNSMNPTR